MDFDDSNDDEIDVKNDIFNYKGYFVENEEEEVEPKYYEFGAHFAYKDLYKVLLTLKEKQLKEEKSNEIEKIKHINKKKIVNKERNNTKNKNKKNESNLNNIIQNFKFKVRSRNIGIDNEDENQNDMTYVPKISFKNNLSIKNDDKNQRKSLNVYKTNYNKSNYLKIYRNIKNKININIKSNKKFNFSNKYKKNQLNQIKIGKYSDKYILKTYTNQKNLNKPNKLLPINKTLNQENNKSNNNIYDMNMQNIFQTQIKQIKINSKKRFKLNDLITNSNSNKNDVFKKNSKESRGEAKIIIKENLNLKLNKNTINNNNKNNANKVNTGNSFSCNIKNNLKKINQKIVSTPLECLLNSYKSKNIKYSPEISQNIFGTTKLVNNKNNSSYKVRNQNKTNNFKNISIEKYIPVKLNKHLDVFESKGIISISIDNNNKKNYFNNKKNEKNKIIKKNNIMIQSSINTNKTFPNISTDCLDKSNRNTNSNINTNKNNDAKNSKENLNNLNYKKEKSRNQINNFLINNISSINYLENKDTNTLSNNNDFAKINHTIQNHTYIKNKNKDILKNKTLINLKKNQINDKYKKVLIGFPSSSNKKIGYLSQLDNNTLFKYYYSTSFLGKKNKKSKINNSKINQLLISKSKQRLNLKKVCIVKSKNKESIFSKNNKINLTSNNDNNNNNIQNNQSNNFARIRNLKKNNKNNSVVVKSTLTNNKSDFKKYQSLINKKDNNINIRININNNNIIYNKIVNNKSNNSIEKNNNKNIVNTDKNIIDVEFQKINKSTSFNKTKNNTKCFNKNINYMKNKVSQKVNNNNNNLKKDDKVKFINVQFPKAKLLNLFNNN